MEIAERAAYVGNRVLSFIAFLLMLLLLLYGAYSLWDVHRIYTGAFVSDDLLRYKAGRNGLDNRESFSELQKINPDVCAWITIDGTHIDYPVVQGKDDMEYVNKDVYGNFSLSGAIFLSSKNSRDFSDPYNLTYGHHMDNGAMYGDVIKFTNEKFFDKHRTGKLYLPDKTYRIDLYAALECDAYEENVYSVGNILSNRHEFDEFIKKNAKVYRETKENAGKQVLCLSTCTSGTTNGRVALFAYMTPLDKEER